MREPSSHFTLRVQARQPSGVHLDQVKTGRPENTSTLSHYLLILYQLKVDAWLAIWQR